MSQSGSMTERFSNLSCFPCSRSGILHNTNSISLRDLDFSWQTQMLEAWYRIWTDYFPESRPKRRETVELMHYAVSVLSGLAATKILEGGDRRLPSRELGFLKQTLVREIGR